MNLQINLGEKIFIIGNFIIILYSVRIGSLKACPKKKFAVKTISKEKIKSNIYYILY